MIKSSQSNPKEAEDEVMLPSNSAFAMQALVQEEVENNPLRPQDLETFIGQNKLKKQLRLILESAKKRNQLPEHLLFYGNPGLGKTSLAYVIANEMKAECKVIAAPTLQRAGDIVSLLLNLQPNTILFIDEIHRLRSNLEETMYSAMEDGQVDLLMGKGHGAQPVRLPLPPLTIIGATTMRGKISKPLQDRFPSIFRLEPYDHGEIVKLITQNEPKLEIKVDEKAKEFLAERCRGVPRVANNFLKRLRDYQVVHDLKSINLEQVKDFLSEIGITDYGLTEMDIRYLKSLENNTLGLKTLSAILREEEDTVETVIEPFLLASGYVDKDSRGRALTIKGREMLDKLGGVN